MVAYRTDIVYGREYRPAWKLKQYGSNRAWLFDHAYRPSLQRLNDYHRAVLYESTYSGGLAVMEQTLLSMLGEPEHPDADIQAFVRYAVQELETPLPTLMQQMIHTAFWAGYSVSEVLFALDGQGRLVLRDVVTYHPATIILRTDDRGRLTDGRPSATGLKSGIYQSGRLQPEVRLPLWKVVRLVHDPSYHPYYGRSVVEGGYKYYLLKEALLDMMAVALDRFGNPLLFIRVPRNATGEMVYDPATGEQRPLTAQEMVEREIQNLGGGNALVLTQADPDLAPEVKALTTGNNLGETFLSAIRYCEQEIARSMLVPFILLGRDTSTLSAAGAAERQMELFNMVLRGLHKQLIEPLAQQLFRFLVRFNFDRPGVEVPVRLPLRNTTRPEDRVGLMQIIRGLTADGYLNPQNEEDWNSVRQMLQMAERRLEEADREFVYNQVLAAKLQGHRYAEPGRPSGTSAPKQPSA